MKINKFALINKILLCALALQAVPAHAIEDPFKKVGKWFETTAKDVGKGISTAATSVKTFAENTAKDIAQYATLSGPKMVEALRGQVGKLKEQFRQYGGRIITGNLPMKDKVAVFGTIIAIVTLTALVAGVSIIAIKNKQQEAIAQKAKEISDKTATGIKGIFLKAKNALEQFDANLKSLGQCLKTGSCTQGQKQFLYGAAITVAALTLLAIGIGVGAFFYKKHQSQQEVDLPGGGDMDLEVIEQEIITAPTQEDRNTKTQQLLSKLKNKIDSALKPISESSNKFANFFAGIADTDQPGPFSDTAQYIKRQLTAANAAYQQAATAVGSVKTELALEAKKSFRLAKAAAKKFIDTISQSAGEFITVGLANILAITPEPIKQGFDKVINAKNSVKSKIENLTGLAQVKTINENIENIQKDTAIITKTLLDAKIASGDAGAQLEAFLYKQNFTKNKVDDILAEFNRLISDGATPEKIQQTLIEKGVDQTTIERTLTRQSWWQRTLAGVRALAGGSQSLTMVQSLVDKVNTIGLKSISARLLSLSDFISQLIKTVANINSIPVAGDVLIPQNLSTALNNLAEKVKDLGKTIRTIFNIEPLIVKYPESITQTVLKGVPLAGLSFDDKPGTELFKQLNKVYDILYTELPIANKLMDAELEQVQGSAATMISNIKNDFKNEISSDIIKLKDAPLYLARAFGQYITNLRNKVGTYLNGQSRLIEKYASLLGGLSSFLDYFNIKLGSFLTINPSLHEQLKGASKQLGEIKGLIAQIADIVQKVTLPIGKKLPYDKPQVPMPVYDPTPQNIAAQAA